MIKEIIFFISGWIIISSCQHTKNNHSEKTDQDKIINEIYIPDTNIDSKKDPLKFRKNQQLIIIVTENEIDYTGYLFKYELINKNWFQQGQIVDVTIGKNGMTKGRGKEIGFTAQGDNKTEGDGKSPSGIFTIGNAFGFMSEDSVEGVHLDYLPITDQTRCIEDDKSNYYNQIIQNDKIIKDWTFADEMRKVKLYEWGFFVNHNIPAFDNAGSCIFFHIWRAPGKYTLGCTAMSKENMIDLLNWIDPLKGPMIVQYIKSDYQILRSRMNLPDIIMH